MTEKTTETSEQPKTILFKYAKIGNIEILQDIVIDNKNQLSLVTSVIKNSKKYGESNQLHIGICSNQIIIDLLEQGFKITNKITISNFNDEIIKDL